MVVGVLASGRDSPYRERKAMLENWSAFIAADEPSGSGIDIGRAPREFIGVEREVVP